MSFKQIRGEVVLKIKKTILSINLGILGGINVCFHPLTSVVHPYYHVQQLSRFIL
jgi:hypothetical protein